MNQTLFFATASMLAIATTIIAAPAQAVEVDCVNHWVNPETQLVQCFDSELNYIPVPSNYFQQINNRATAANNNTVVRRRATNLDSNNMADTGTLDPNNCRN